MASGNNGNGKSMRWLKRGAAGVALAIGLALFIVTHIDTPAPYVEWKIPEHPVAKAAYDYAHSIKLPDSVPKPVPFKFCRYNVLGLCFGKATRDEYFEHLCRTEAGEYVFRRVEGVEGIVDLRPRWRARTDGETTSRYVLEDPLSWAGDATFTPLTNNYMGLVFVQPPGQTYDFYDAYVLMDRTFQLIRFYKDESVDPDNRRANTRRDGTVVRWILNSRKIDESSAAYGIVLRGTRRDRDREFGIAGSEAILVDRSRTDVLAVRRDFAQSPIVENKSDSVDWDLATSCLNARKPSGKSFVLSVLRPKAEE